MRAFARWLWLLALLAAGLGAARADGPPPLAIGFYLPVIRDVPRKDVEVSLRFWAEELARGANMGFQPVRMYDKIADMKHDVDAGLINMVVATSMGLVQHFRAEELADAFTGYKVLSDDLILVVRRNVGIRSPTDLAGKRLSLLDADELTDIYLATLLMKSGLRADFSQLAEVRRKRTGNKSVLDLFFDKADAALVYRNSFETAIALNPQVGQVLQVLEAYTFKTRSPFTALFSSRMRPEYRTLLMDSAMKSLDSPRGRQVLEIYHGEVFERSRVQDLEPYRQLLENYRALRATSSVERNPAK